jgi:DNA polymerase-3 subunit epsilon
MNILIFFDTETTGLNPNEGHRIVEIGAIKMKGGIIQEDKEHIFHHYVNPERNIGPEVIKIHGITNEKVKNSPKFREIAQNFLNFIKDGILVAHNASFDIKFINYQLKLCGLPELQNQVIDTLVLAKKKYPGSPASLDALCKRFSINLQERTFHGALLDSKLLACVYRKMTTHDNDNYFLYAGNNDGKFGSDAEEDQYLSHFQKMLKEFAYAAEFTKVKATEQEKQNHADFLKQILS